MAELRIAFIGAGQVNFGGGEGPWNHAKRVEALTSIAKGDTNVPLKVSVVGIADPFDSFAQKVLENQRQKSSRPEVWKDTKVYSNYLTMINELEIDAIIIGVPPAAHGSTKSPNSIEIDCAAKGIHMLIEKPISCHSLDEVQQVCDALRNAEKENGLIVSVAYMFRYNRALAKMKELIAEHGDIRAFNARYMCAYSTLNKDMWWDVQRSGGPIVEQATHFCDLARFLGGDINLDSVRAISIKQNEPAAKLSAIPPNIRNMESALPEKSRTPRVTNAFWKYASGAIGNLMHGVLLHGQKYETEIEVLGDGYRMVLSDPYGKCELSVLPDSETATVYRFGDDDMYLHEVQAFVEAVVNKDSKRVQSTYEDAFDTYAFTWKIRSAAEDS